MFCLYSKGREKSGERDKTWWRPEAQLKGDRISDVVPVCRRSQLFASVCHVNQGDNIQCQWGVELILLSQWQLKPVTACLKRRLVILIPDKKEGSSASDSSLALDVVGPPMT